MKKVKYYTKQEALQELEKLPDDKMYAIVKKVKRRTIPQNSLLHLYFNIISDRMCELGDEITPDLLKEVLKTKLGKTFERKGVQYTKPTSEYDTVELNEFVESMKIFCRDYLDFELPDPNDKRLLEYYQNNYM